MDYLQSQILFYTSKKYEDIYLEIADKHKLSYAQLFTLLAAIGFKNNRRSSFSEKGREFRSSYLKDDAKSIIYTILLSDEMLKLDVEDLIDKNRFKDYTKQLEEYADGGMEILIEEVFPPNIAVSTRSKKYSDYMVDIVSYVYKSTSDAPF